MNRNLLINLAYKYHGEYSEIVKAIKNDEKIEINSSINYDNCITIFDKDYPKDLLLLENPPFVLFYKGNLSLLKNKKAGVVGTRIPCKYAIDSTIKLCTQLANKGVTIVSGLAKGIDATAHSTCTNSIAILGCGIDYIYPSSNAKLFKAVEANGLILSEYPINTAPLAYHFPIRNRITAALSDELYVMQCTDRSGTLSTINRALELNKNVKILPFHADEEDGKFNNHLIEEGASIISL